MRPLRIASTAFLLIILLMPATPAATPTLDEVAKALRLREQLFFESQSVHIKCAWGDTRHVYLDDAGERKLVELIRTNRFMEIRSAFPQQTIMRTPGYSYELAKRGTKLFQFVTNPLDVKFGAEGTTGVFDGAVGLMLQERKNAIIQDTPPAYAWQNWDYTNYQHLNVCKYVTGLDVSKFPPAKRPVGLPDDIWDARGSYAVSRITDVNGTQCVQLDKSDSWSFLLDPARGYAVTRVGKFLPGKHRAPGALQSWVTMSDFRLVRPGLWLPWAITEELYFSMEQTPKERWGKPALRRTLSVSSISFDDLSDAFFHVELPENVIVHDNIRKIMYRMQTGGVPFASAIEFASQHTAPVSGNRWRLISLLVGNAGAGLALLWFWRRASAQRKKTQS